MLTEHACSIVYDTFNTPFYENRCDHANYVGSVKVYKNISTNLIADVYIYDDAIRKTQHTCIRTGDEMPDYLLLGTIIDTIIACHKSRSQLWQACGDLLKKRLNAKFEITKKV